MGTPLAKKTLAEFLAWEEHQPERHEFFRGETFARVGGTARHTRVIMNLGSSIAAHLDGTGCQAFTESMKVQIAEGILYSDVVVTCGKAEAGDEQIVTDPKLIIEVLSPSTKGYGKWRDGEPGTELEPSSAMSAWPARMPGFGSYSFKVRV